MKVLLLSKACIVGSYQRKLEEIASQPGVELLAVVPPSWRDERGELPLEVVHTQGYTLAVEPLRFNGNFHLHYYPHIGKRIQSFRPDIVHIDEEPYNFATWHTLRLSRQLQAKTLFFSWQNLLRRYPPPFAWWEASVLRQIDFALCGNQAAVEVWRAKGYRGDIQVLPQFGVDPDLYPFAPRAPQSTFVIGFAGRFVPEKGAHLLLQALAGLPAAARLVLVGSGPEQASLQAQAAQLGLTDRLSWVSWLPSGSFAQQLHQFDVLVLPSISRPNWQEQFGRVLVEAMACGVPVVGSRCGEIPQVIGTAGLLFAEGDVPALTAALAQLYASPTLRHDLAAAGRARVLANFTQAQIARETVAIYRRMLHTEPKNNLPT
jgi:glycosyltransferase involved in cell wall biosynthesis